MLASKLADAQVMSACGRALMPGAERAVSEAVQGTVPHK
jgi:hypothetical protein